MNIYEKMSAITAEIKRIPKNLTVGTGKNQYKAVAEGDILAVVKDAEKKYKVFSYPHSHKIVDSRTLVTKNDYGEKESQFVRIEAVYRFVNMEDPKEFVDVNAFGDGVDSLDKAPGKATTYADKYALMKAYKVETGEDTDCGASDDLLGHDIWKIKQRVEQIITAKLQSGLSQDEIIARAGLNRKQFDACMNAFQNVAALEAKMKKV
ncbi:MAG: ERF family protein [Ruthenibacterium lactatiformans]|uniref:ERF family protein n=1 Tax=Ruthenibacterium lactatiformans TaxID=1550024 RepID=UPI001966DA32|nr:ERF family protein [Ruthenibacterium lactatiformans]MBN2995822.1 ERF family protein [Ruthenibacterium lactatiformans]